MSIAEPGDLELAFQARLETEVHRAESQGGHGRLERLAAEAARELGPENPTVFLIKASCQEMLSHTRPVTDSVREWEKLADVAGRALGSGTPVLRRIKLFLMRYRRAQGRPEDLARGVEEYRAEWELLSALEGPDCYETRVARGNYAVALRDRGGPGDLDEALDMLHEEAEFRRVEYRKSDPFVWVARSILAQTLVVRAARSPAGQDREAPARKALDLACSIHQDRQIRFGPSNLHTLQARLIVADALLSLGRPQEAVEEIRDVLAISVASSVPLAPGWVDSLLARAERDRGDHAAARSAAVEAISRMERILPPGNVWIMAMESFLEELPSD